VVARNALGGEGQREQHAAWEAALLAAGLPVAGLDAPKSKPRLLHAAPLSGAIPGEAELVDLWLVERLPAWRVREALAGHLPPGYRLVELYDVWLGEASLPGRVAAAVYRAVVDVPPDVLVSACTRLLAADSLPRARQRGETSVAYDLRPFVLDLETGPGPDAGSSILRMTLRHDPEKGIGRPEELLAALGDELGDELGRAITATTLVRESVVLGEPAPPAPPPRRGPRPVRR
jgi:hypothetical protein